MIIVIIIKIIIIIIIIIIIVNLWFSPGPWHYFLALMFHKTGSKGIDALDTHLMIDSWNAWTQWNAKIPKAFFIRTWW